MWRIHSGITAAILSRGGAAVHPVRPPTAALDRGGSDRRSRRRPARLGRVARLVSVARAVERRDRLGERLRGLIEPRVAHPFIDLRQLGPAGAEARGRPQRVGELKRRGKTILGALGERWNMRSSTG
jgi:hypothetical protein